MYISFPLFYLYLQIIKRENPTSIKIISLHFFSIGFKILALPMIIPWLSSEEHLDITPSRTILQMRSRNITHKKMEHFFFLSTSFCSFKFVLTERNCQQQQQNPMLPWDNLDLDLGSIWVGA